MSSSEESFDIAARLFVKVLDKCSGIGNWNSSKAFMIGVLQQGKRALRG
jgi:hypothetical protein